MPSGGSTVEMGTKKSENDSTSIAGLLRGTKYMRRFTVVAVERVCFHSLNIEAVTRPLTSSKPRYNRIASLSSMLGSMTSPAFHIAICRAAR